MRHIIPDDLGQMLLDSSRRLKWNMTGRLIDVGLTFPQWMVLNDIFTHADSEGDKYNLTPAAVAGRLSVDRPTISGIIERLEKGGWIYRADHPEDRRSYIVMLTGKATELMSELEEQRKLTMDQAIRGFSEDETTLLKQYLQRIINNLKL